MVQLIGKKVLELDRPVDLVSAMVEKIFEK